MAVAMTLEIPGKPCSIGLYGHKGRESPDSLASAWLIRYVHLEKFGSRAVGIAEGVAADAQR
jgi:hypothetical protein